MTFSGGGRKKLILGSLWLVATIVSALMTALFCGLLVYYLQHYDVTWRVIAPISLVVFWVTMTQSAFVKFKTRMSK